MKTKFRIFSIILAVAILLSAMIIPTSAATAPEKFGDVDRNNHIDVMDATSTQYYVAKMNKYIFTKDAADVDNDAKITVIDATIIQQFVAKVITEFPAGEYYSRDKYFHGVTADYDKDSAMVGYPVTFTVSGDINPGPAIANLYINEELVYQTREHREDNSSIYDLTYTFEKAGAYRVKITLADKWGNVDDVNQWGNNGWSALYLVKDAPTDTSTPIITSIIHSDIFVPTDTFTVHTKFGTEPYQYKYTLYEFDREIFATDYLDTSTLKLTDAISSMEYLDFGEYTIKVDLKDANGKTTTDKLTFSVEPVIV